jgi:hypothetical protein
LPIEQTLELFRDVGLVVQNIMDGIHLMYVWSRSLTKCIITYWGMTIIELSNDITMVANIM